SSWRAALLLGLAVGGANATKTSAIALFVLPVAAAVTWTVQHEQRLATRAWAAFAIAMLVALPVWLRNHLLFGSAFYPAGAPDLDRELYRLHLARFGVPAGEFYVRVSAAFGPIVVAIGLAALVVAIARKRRDLVSGFLAYGAALVVIAPLLPVHDVRHVLPLIAPLALAASLVL